MRDILTPFIAESSMSQTTHRLKKVRVFRSPSLLALLCGCETWSSDTERKTCTVDVWRQGTEGTIWNPKGAKWLEAGYSCRYGRQAGYRLLYAFFWVIPRRLNFIFRRFGTLCSIFIGR